MTELRRNSVVSFGDDHFSSSFPHLKQLPVVSGRKPSHDFRKVCVVPISQPRPTDLSSAKSETVPAAWRPSANMLEAGIVPAPLDLDGVTMGMRDCT